MGACPEFLDDSGHCYYNVDCGPCQSTYLDDVINNENCAHASCGAPVSCLMFNLSGSCDYTRNYWAWTDEDGNGVLDYCKRRVTGSSFVWIKELDNGQSASTTNYTDGYSYSQKWNTWAVAGVRDRNERQYSLELYSDNNHHYMLATSNTDGVDFIVSDYNHERQNNQHLQVLRSPLPGSKGYRVQYESGTEMLFADGVARAGSWAATDVVQVWDLPLFGGERVGISLEITSGDVDLGWALFQSNGGQYHASRSAAVADADRHGPGESEDTFVYAVPADDVYGLVMWSNNEETGSYTIRIGEPASALEEETPVSTNASVGLYQYTPNALAWSFVGTRPASGTNVSLRLFEDAAYQTELESSDDQSGMEFVAVDYNDGSSTDHLRIVKETGTGDYATEWEHDEDLLGGAVAGSWTTGHVGKIWDAYLVSGQQYVVRTYVSDGLSAELYAFSSGDGERYKSKSARAALGGATADGGRLMTYTPGVSDWYGIVQAVQAPSAGTYSIWLGPYAYCVDNGATRWVDEVVFGQAAPFTGSWSACAVRPGADDNASIWLFSDNQYDAGNLLASDETDRRVPLLVGDHHHLPNAAVWPRVRRTAGTQPCDLDWERNAEDLTYNGQVITLDRPWSAHNVIEVFNLYVAGGVTGGVDVRIRVEDLGGTIDPGIALFASNGGSYWANLDGAVASADVDPTGEAEQIEAHVTQTDWYGVVIWSKDDVDGGGTYRLEISNPQTVEVGPPTEIPELDLAVCGRNPSADRTSLRCSLPEDGPVDLGVFDVTGRRVQTLLRGQVAAGEQLVTWDGRDDSGMPAPSGVYFVRLKTDAGERKSRLNRSQ